MEHAYKVLLRLRYVNAYLPFSKFPIYCSQGVWFNIKLLCPNLPKLDGFQMNVQTSFNVATITSDTKNVDTKWTVEELLENLPDLIKNFEFFSENQHAKVYNEISQLENVYADIAGMYLPSEYEIQTNESCSRVRFCNFLQNEQHYLEVALPSLQLLDHSLPTCIAGQELLGKAPTLSILLQQFRRLLEDLRPFYDSFTDIDELCHVVQPTIPTTKENWRLFMLKERIFLKLQFSDPFSPLGSMTVHIIGPTTEVTNLRRIYSEGLRDWDGELDVHKNLLRIFDLCFFPMPPSNACETTLQYCNICYSYKLDHGEIPIISCDNPHCYLIFHSMCLKEWFNTLADGKTFLDVAFGACPFCKAVGLTK